MKQYGFLIVVIAMACSPQERTGVTQREPVTTIDSVALSHAEVVMRKSVDAFYRSRGFRMVWNADSVAADSLLAFVANVERHGLYPADYHLATVQALLTDSLNASAIRAVDVLLTDAYFLLRRHLLKGKLKPLSHEPMDVQSIHDSIGAEELRADARRAVAALEQRGPAHEQYYKLKSHLSQLLKAPRDSVNDAQIKAISYNMERWRWTAPYPDRYIRVLIPAYDLTVQETDSLFLRSRVIVGKRQTPTPVMRSLVHSFIIYPYWHVPKSIATKELLPAIQKDSSYLRKHNYQVLDRSGNVVDAKRVPWGELSVDHFPYVLRQREGSENTLGVIKFVFDNRYGVYLHDTNSKRSFSKKRRDLSHGCVRVQRAADLARYLVRDDSIYVTPDDLDQYLSLQQRLKLNVKRPIPVFLDYFTCEWKDDSVYFYEDIYRKDSLMSTTFFSNPF